MPNTAATQGGDGVNELVSLQPGALIAAPVTAPPCVALYRNTRSLQVWT